MISTNKKKMKQKMGYLSVAAAAGLFFASSFPLRFFWCGLLFVGGFLWLLYGKHRLSRCAVIVLLAAFTLSGSWYYGYTKLVYDPVISLPDRKPPSPELSRIKPFSTMTRQAIR